MGDIPGNESDIGAAGFQGRRGGLDGDRTCNSGPVNPVRARQERVSCRKQGSVAGISARFQNRTRFRRGTKSNASAPIHHAALLDGKFRIEYSYGDFGPFCFSHIPWVPSCSSRRIVWPDAGDLWENAERRRVNPPLYPLRRQISPARSASLFRAFVEPESSELARKRDAKRRARMSSTTAFQDASGIFASSGEDYRPLTSNLTSNSPERRIISGSSQQFSGGGDEWGNGTEGWRDDAKFALRASRSMSHSSLACIPISGRWRERIPFSVYGFHRFAVSRGHNVAVIQFVLCRCVCFVRFACVESG